MITVSVVITTHNRANLLKEAIESVINQTYKCNEIIVVDDASTDNTQEVCRLYPVNYIYIPKTESKGGNYARNQGIIVSSSTYLAFMDDDDVWFPTKIEKQVALMQEGNYAVVHCGRIIHYKERNGYEHEKILIPTELDRGNMSSRILYRLTITTSTLFVKRKTIIKVGMFDEQLRFWQEYELLMRLAQEGEFAYVAEPLCWYRVDRTDTNRLTNKFFAWIKSVEYIKQKHFSLFHKLTWKERLHEKLLYNLDASIRCKNSGMIIRGSFYYMKRQGLRLILLVVDKENL